MAKFSAGRMQKLIDRTSRASVAYHQAQAALNDACQDVYGCEPGDVDADQIIDAVFGGGGVASGMKADEFDIIMRECIAQKDH